MTVDKILRGESKEIEYKETVPANSRKYTKTVVAYADCAIGETVTKKQIDNLCETILDPAKVQVAICDDRFEVASLGMLIDGVTRQALKDGCSRSRNRGIVNTIQDGINAIKGSSDTIQAMVLNLTDADQELLARSPRSPRAPSSTSWEAHDFPVPAKIFDQRACHEVGEGVII